ncbi:MAG: hypothetical protein J2P45_27295 [Candidatus Dormibacteraeota bacterium]|nr:hypothetical protein [Candidatus Dormibacteraeota bacterium]
METFLLVALGVFLALALLGLGTGLALFFSLRHLTRRFRRAAAGTRVGTQVGRMARLAGPMVVHREALRLAPPRATELTFRIQRKALALEAIAAQLSPESRFRVVETSRRYLPDTLNAYRLASAGRDRRQRTEAAELLVGQLSEVEAMLDGIAVGSGDAGLAALRANGAFLNVISGRLQERSQDSSEERALDSGPGSKTPPAAETT